MNTIGFSARDLSEHVVLVDENDAVLETVGKIPAHQSGRLHRAFSVFLVDGAGRVLLQQRALEKYHSGGLWANSCCGHPRPGEDVVPAAERRVFEELGMQCRLSTGFTSRYRAELDHNMTENEFVHVLFGTCGSAPNLNPVEVQTIRWVDAYDLKALVNSAPHRYTAWMHHYVRQHHEQIIGHARTHSQREAIGRRSW